MAWRRHLVGRQGGAQQPLVQVWPRHGQTLRENEDGCQRWGSPRWQSGGGRIQEVSVAGVCNSWLIKDLLIRLLVPALKWLQEPRRRGMPPPGHQDGPPKVDCQINAL